MAKVKCIPVARSIAKGLLKSGREVLHVGLSLATASGDCVHNARHGLRKSADSGGTMRLCVGY